MTFLPPLHKWIIAGSLSIALLVGGIGFVFAQEASGEGQSEQIATINEEIQTKKANIDQINRKIDEYRKQISKKQTESSSLAGELDLLENRMAKTELDIEVAEAEIDLVNAEIRKLDEDVGRLEAELERERAIMIEILQELQKFDNDLTLQVVFGSDSFSDVFNHLHYLENVNEDLGKSVEAAKVAKQQVVDSKTSQEGKKARLESLQDTLKKTQIQLESEANAKESILAETQESAAQYLVLLRELREEQANIDYEISRLQGEIEQKLDQSDLIGDSTILTWPVPSDSIITATFHDPTYPFRHLFEHSGLDIAVSQGTALKAAAPGYVAWTRTGNSYGNYVMIIHANGMATLYAHMSGFAVEPDQFVSRGQIIGYSGGTPGTPGAGLSTGAHLHFEVRKNGIPVNPLSYLLDE